MRLNRCRAWIFRACIFRTCIGFLGSAPFALAQQAAPDWGLPQLMQGLAQVRSASARFAERETVPMLNAPLMTSGTLRYVAPDYVRKTTVLPMPEDFVLDHDMVTLTSGANHQTERFSLRQAPQIGGLVEGIRATLAGDLPALEQIYTVRFSGTAAKWQLLLQPKNPDVTRFVEWIVIQGRQNQIDAVDTASANGGHTEMGISEDLSDAR
jgi:hypothetical protein